MRVAILGCGPAGLTAAQAAVDLGHDITIFSKEQKPSTQYGCQYFHAPVPGYEDVPSVRVRYTLSGTPEEYREKVYGNAWKGRVSPEDFIGEHTAWDIRETYRRMWLRFFPYVHTYDIREGNIPRLGMESDFGRFDKIISSIPAGALCYRKHSFHGHAIYASGSTTFMFRISDEVICDGTGMNPWYRLATVFGHSTIEWSSRQPQPPGSVLVLKPLATDCDCSRDIIRVGRYGEWDKSVLVHQVYSRTQEALR